MIMEVPSHRNWRFPTKEHIHVTEKLEHLQYELVINLREQITSYYQIISSKWLKSNEMLFIGDFA